MTGDQRHLDVPELLRDWAGSQPPQPSRALTELMSGTTPVLGLAAAAPRPRARAVRRTGLTVKVALVVTGLTITSAAAVGLTQSALGPAEPGPTSPTAISTDLDHAASARPSSSASPRSDVRAASTSAAPVARSASSEPSRSARRTESPEPRSSAHGTGEPRESSAPSREPQSPDPVDTAGGDTTGGASTPDPADSGTP